jgi:ABC-type branched-subunit amino acid transport system substrate-binding protein
MGMHVGYTRARAVPVAVAISMFVGLVGCGGEEQGSGGGGGDTFTLGFITPASGPQATSYVATRQGVEAAISVVNEKNLAGRKLVMKFADDGNDPRTATQACKRLVQKDKIQGMVGFEATPTRSACNPALQAKSIPYVAGQPSAGDYCPPNMFLNGLIPNQLFKPVIEYMLKTAGTESVYFVGNNYSSAKGVEKLLKTVLPSTGAKLAGSSYQSFGTTEWSSEISKIGRSKADTIVVSLVGNDEVSFWKSVAADTRVSKLTKIDPLLTTSAADATGPAIKGVVTVNSYFADLEGPGNELYKQTLGKKFGSKAKIDPQGAHLWDAVFMMAAAIKKANSTDGAKITQALKTIATDPAQSPRGEVRIVDKGFAQVTAHVGIAQGDGTFKLVGEGNEKPAPSC